MPANEAFLGTGWSFPPSFAKLDPNQGEVLTTFGVEDIERSLEIIFTTALGERIMNPSFGCSLADMVFEPMNAGRITYVENLLATAILYHEPRIDAETIEVRPDDQSGTLLIRIQYKVRANNSRFNFVFPFYLTAPGA